MQQQQVVRKPKFKETGYDVVFQSKILRMLYQDPTYAASTAANLTADHFDNRLHRWLCSVILDYSRNNSHSIPLDGILLKAKRDISTGRLQLDDARKLTAFTKLLVKPLKDRSFVKEELSNFVQNQMWREFLIDAMTHLRKQEFSKIYEKSKGVLSIQFMDSGGLGTHYVRDVRQRVKRRQVDDLVGKPTGTSLDNYLRHGGLPPTKVGGIMGVYGTGKSHLLVHFGGSVILESDQTERVCHIQLEGSQEDTCDRYDAWFSKTPINLLKAKRKTVQKKIKKLGQKYGDFLVVKKFPARRLTVSGIRAYLRQLESVGFYPTVLLLDYLGLMRDEEGAKEKHDAMSNVVQGLQTMAEEQKLAVWLALQANRGSVQQDSLDKDSVGGSFAVGQDLDVLVAWSQTAKEKTVRRARLSLIKNRLGPDGIEIPVSHDWSKSRVKCLD